MNLREHFEKLHPVPDGINFDRGTYLASWGLIGEIGLENAAVMLDTHLEKWATYQVALLQMKGNNP